MTRKTLYAGSLFWPTTISRVPAYEQLGARHEQYDAVVVGGGMSGVLCGYELACSGIRTAVVERGDIAGGSTSASTGIIQFANDIMLSELADRIGESRAAKFYTACKKAVDYLALLAGKIDVGPDFKRRSSLYVASSEQDVPKLQREYEMLRRHGFHVEWWTPQKIRSHFPFTKPGAIVTHGDAEVHPVRIVHGIAEAAAASGLTIYEHTDMISHTTPSEGVHRLTTSEGGSLTCSNVIYAVGYEPEELRGQLIKAVLHRTFALVTEPQPAAAGFWHERFMIWETARPYLYIRTTPDNRIVIGGLDEETPAPLAGVHARRKRIDDLYRRLKEMFPAMTAPIAYEWSATFGESRDGLPFIGPDPARAGVYYSLGYGGNGTVYSVIAGRLIRDMILGEKPHLSSIVGLDRPTLKPVH